MTDLPDPDMSLQSRALLVISTSRGIGRAVALALGADLASPPGRESGSPVRATIPLEP